MGNQLSRYLTEIQRRGFITTPILLTVSEADDWIVRCRDCLIGRFVPAFKGEEAINLLRQIPRQETFNRLQSDFDPEAGVEVIAINDWHILSLPDGLGWVVVLNADFYYAGSEGVSRMPTGSLSPDYV